MDDYIQPSSVYIGPNKPSKEAVENNYHLIAPAQAQLEPFQGYLSHQKNQYEGEGNWFSTEVISHLKDKGVYFVTFTPDFYSCRSMIRLDPYTVYGEASKKTRATFREAIKHVEERVPRWAKPGGTSKFLTHKHVNNFVERMLENHEKMKYGHKYPLGRWRIEVGLLNPYMNHIPPENRAPVRYGLLFAILLSLGYDPLLPARQKRFIDSIRKEMAATIITAINKGRTGSALGIKSKLSTIGQSVVNHIREYIAGGAKPRLSSRTLKNREYRARQNGALYPNGINEPLSETGQLEQAISFRVIGENEWTKEVSEVEKARRAERHRLNAEKYRLEKEARKASTKWIDKAEFDKKNALKKRAKSSKRDITQLVKGSRQMSLNDLFNQLVAEKAKDNVSKEETKSGPTKTVDTELGKKVNAIISEQTEALAIEQAKLLKQTKEVKTAKQLDIEKYTNIKTSIGEILVGIVKQYGTTVSAVPKEVWHSSVPSDILEQLAAKGVSGEYSTFLELHNAWSSAKRYLDSIAHDSIFGLG